MQARLLDFEETAIPKPAHVDTSNQEIIAEQNDKRKFGRSQL